MAKIAAPAYRLKMKYSEKAKLNFLLGVAVLTVILDNLVLNNIPEIFSRGYELGQILSNLGLSFIASYIFYLVVVVAKDKRDKQNVLSTVYKLTGELVGRAYSVYDNVAEAAGEINHEGRKTISREDFLRLCSKANPHGISPNRRLGTNSNPRQATYGELTVSNAYDNVRALSEQIFVYMPYLDSEQVRLMNQLLNSDFHMMAPSLRIAHNPSELYLGNKNFTAWANEAYEFIQYVRQLGDYNEKYNQAYLGTHR